LAANIGFLAILALGGRLQSDYGPSRAIEVQLTPPAPPEVRRPRSETPATQPGRRRAPAKLPPPEATTGQVTRPEVTPPPVSATREAPSGLAWALRRGLGCDHADFMALTAAERQHCRDRLAAATERASETASLGVEPGKRAIFDLAAKRDHWLQEPFLAEKPKKGCRPRVTEQDVAANAPAPQDWTVGVSCGVQF
jgi:hypothetical protein